MSSKPSIDLSQILKANELIASFYTTTLSDGMVEATIRTMSALIGGDMHLAFLTHHEGPIFHATSDGEVGRKLLINTMSAATSHPLIYRTSGSVRAVSDVLSTKEWHQREMYQIAKPIIRMEDSLGVDLDFAPGISFSTCVIREKRGFSESERLLFKQMLPHFDAVREMPGAFASHDEPFQIFELDSLPKSRNGLIRQLRGLSQHDGRDLNAAVIRLADWIQSIRVRNETRHPLTVKFPISSDPSASTCLALLIPKIPVGKSNIVISFPWNGGNSQPCSNPYSLTPRELEVSRWLCLGKTNSEIAIILEIRPGTIKRHVENIFEKLGVPNRSAAIYTILGSSE